MLSGLIATWLLLGEVHARCMQFPAGTDCDACWLRAALRAKMDAAQGKKKKKEDKKGEKKKAASPAAAPAPATAVVHAEVVTHARAQPQAGPAGTIGERRQIVQADTLVWCICVTVTLASETCCRQCLLPFLQLYH